MKNVKVTMINQSQLYFCKNQWEIKEEYSYLYKSDIIQRIFFCVTCTTHECSFDPPSSLIDTFYACSLVLFANG